METHGESWNIILVSSSKAHGLTIVDGFGASLAHQALSENDLQIVVFFPWIHKIYVNGLEWKINAICWFNIAMGNPPFLVYSLFFSLLKGKICVPSSIYVDLLKSSRKKNINKPQQTMCSIYFPMKKKRTLIRSRRNVTRFSGRGRNFEARRLDRCHDLSGFAGLDGRFGYPKKAKWQGYPLVN